MGPPQPTLPTIKSRRARSPPTPTLSLARPQTSVKASYIHRPNSRTPNQQRTNRTHATINRRGKKYVRAEILIATNIMRPNRDDPTKTDFISVTHINPGGIADSKIGAKIVNKLCAKAPVNLLVSLERAANSAPVPKAAAATRKAKVAG